MIYIADHECAVIYADVRILCDAHAVSPNPFGNPAKIIKMRK